MVTFAEKVISTFKKKKSKNKTTRQVSGNPISSMFCKRQSKAPEAAEALELSEIASPDSKSRLRARVNKFCSLPPQNCLFASLLRAITHTLRRYLGFYRILRVLQWLAEKPSVTSCNIIKIENIKIQQ